MPMPGLRNPRKAIRKLVGIGKNWKSRDVGPGTAVSLAEGYGVGVNASPNQKDSIIFISSMNSVTSTGLRK